MQNTLFLLRFSFFGQCDIHFRSKNIVHFVTDFIRSVRTTDPMAVNFRRAAGTSCLHPLKSDLGGIKISEIELRIG